MTFREHCNITFYPFEAPGATVPLNGCSFSVDNLFFEGSKLNVAAHLYRPITRLNTLQIIKKTALDPPTVDIRFLSSFLCLSQLHVVLVLSARMCTYVNTNIVTCVSSAMRLLNSYCKGRQAQCKFDPTVG